MGKTAIKGAKILLKQDIICDIVGKECNYRQDHIYMCIFVDDETGGKLALDEYHWVNYEDGSKLYDVIMLYT